MVQTPHCKKNVNQTFVEIDIMTKQRHLVFSGFPRVFLPFPGLSKHNDRHFQTPSFRGTAAQIYPTKLHIQFLFAFVMPIINGCLLEVSDKFFLKQMVSII